MGFSLMSWLPGCRERRQVVKPAVQRMKEGCAANLQSSS